MVLVIVLVTVVVLKPTNSSLMGDQIMATENQNLKFEWSKKLETKPIQFKKIGKGYLQLQKWKGQATGLGDSRVEQIKFFGTVTEK